MNFKRILLYYWKFLRKHLVAQIFVLLGFGIGVLGTTVLIPLVYKEIIDTVIQGMPDAYGRLQELLIILALGILGYNIFFRIGEYALIKSQSKIIKELYDFSFHTLQKHSYVFFSNSFVGGLVAKTKRFVRSFETLHDQLIFQIWMSGVALLSSLVVLWRESSLLGAAFFIWLFLYSFLVKLMVKWQIPKSLASAKADTKTTSQYADIVTNILTVKMFGSGNREEDNFKKTTSSEEEKRTAAWMQQNFWNSMMQSITIGVFNIVIIWFVINLWREGVVQTGTIVLVQVYVLTSFNIVWGISRSIIRVSSAITDSAEMIKIFEKEPEVKDIENPKELKVKEGRVDFKKVSFIYKDGEDVFNELNLSIKPGEKVAFVGYSGAGKTTVVKLLLRFLDIDHGVIEIDGQDISQVRQDDLRESIAYVPQDPSLFHRTVRENIGYGKEGVTFKEIVEAAKKAEAHEFIVNLKDGYDSLVGERGIKLSGGERQRIAIARAILKDAPIVILDEATSSLDSLVEEKIQKALTDLIENKTTIIIAHRLSTIKRMDRIVVFDNGEVIESGSHEDLLQKKGVYYRLWQSQVGGFVIN